MTFAEMILSNEIIAKPYFKLLSNAIMKEVHDRRSDTIKLDTGSIYLSSNYVSTWDYLNDGAIEGLYQKKLHEYYDMGVEITSYGVFPQIDCQEFAELAVLAVYNRDVKFLNEALSQTYIQRFLNTELIDALLEYSIDNQTPETTVLLLEYKRQNNLFKEKNWEL